MILPDSRQVEVATLLNGNEAMALFADRARAVNARFLLTEENAAAVAGIAVGSASSFPTA